MRGSAVDAYEQSHERRAAIKQADVQQLAPATPIVLLRRCASTISLMRQTPIHILFCRAEASTDGQHTPGSAVPEHFTDPAFRSLRYPAPNPGQPNVQDKPRKINSIGKLPLQALELSQILPLTVQ